jgi:hypothetical protein
VVSIAQITDVSSYEGMGITFARMSDTKESLDLQCQEDVGVEKVGDTYLVAVMETGAWERRPAAGGPEAVRDGSRESRQTRRGRH